MNGRLGPLNEKVRLGLIPACFYKRNKARNDGLDPLGSMPSGTECVAS